jgi:hypothetical protein
VLVQEEQIPHFVHSFRRSSPRFFPITAAVDGSKYEKSLPSVPPIQPRSRVKKNIRSIKRTCGILTAVQVQPPSSVHRNLVTAVPHPWRSSKNRTFCRNFCGKVSQCCPESRVWIVRAFSAGSQDEIQPRIESTKEKAGGPSASPACWRDSGISLQLCPPSVVWTTKKSPARLILEAGNRSRRPRPRYGFKLNAAKLGSRLAPCAPSFQPVNR